jgi:superfamily II DNA or RNA helicase
MQLRDYQQVLVNDIYYEWNHQHKNVMPVLATGGGKTVVLAKIIDDMNTHTCAIAHRQELVGQISMALSREGVRHNLIAPKNVIKYCVQAQMEELGNSWFTPNAKCAVAGVDTLVLRQNDPGIQQWAKKVELWVEDEGHHVLRNNKWGKAASIFSNALGLAPTATPSRADGKGLGRHADGLMDALVFGPSMRDLINRGSLTDYRIFAPKTEDLKLEDVDVSKTTGDYNPNKLKTAIRKSHVIGDVVKHYIRFANGKHGVTFATDVETATDIAAQFNQAGIPAAIVSGNTKDAVRHEILRKFKNGELLQLVNVDLFGEGVDVPSIEVVSMARPTQSYGLYCQQFGRALRLLDGKDFAIIIDHVGNVERHGLPDAPRKWTLDAREKRSGGGPSDVIPVTTCTNPTCVAVYERRHNACPYCGHRPIITERSRPEYVDGDLLELDAATLAAMRGEIQIMDRDVADVQLEMQSKYAPRVGVLTAMKRHEKNKEMQSALRASIAWWAGYQKSRGVSDSESYRLFYFRFGIDIMTAQTLKLKEAEELAMQINYYLAGESA